MPWGNVSWGDAPWGDVPWGDVPWGIPGVQGMEAGLSWGCAGRQRRPHKSAGALPAPRLPPEQEDEEGPAEPHKQPSLGVPPSQRGRVPHPIPSRASPARCARVDWGWRYPAGGDPAQLHRCQGRAVTPWGREGVGPHWVLREPVQPSQEIRLFFLPPLSAPGSVCGAGSPPRTASLITLQLTSAHLELFFGFFFFQNPPVSSKRRPRRVQTWGCGHGTTPLRFCHACSKAEAAATAAASPSLELLPRTLSADGPRYFL